MPRPSHRRRGGCDAATHRIAPYLTARTNRVSPRRRRRRRVRVSRCDPLRTRGVAVGLADWNAEHQDAFETRTLRSRVFGNRRVVLRACSSTDLISARTPTQRFRRTCSRYSSAPRLPRWARASTSGTTPLPPTRSASGRKASASARCERGCVLVDVSSQRRARAISSLSPITHCNEVRHRGSEGLPACHHVRRRSPSGRLLARRRPPPPRTATAYAAVKAARTVVGAPRTP